MTTLQYICVIKVKYKKQRKKNNFGNKKRNILLRTYVRGIYNYF